MAQMNPQSQVQYVQQNGQPVPVQYVQVQQPVDGLPPVVYAQAVQPAQGQQQPGAAQYVQQQPVQSQQLVQQQPQPQQLGQGQFARLLDPMDKLDNLDTIFVRQPMRAREVMIELQAGDAVVHHGNTVHRADPNRSTTRHRPAFALVITGVSAEKSAEAEALYEANRARHREILAG